MINNIIDDIFYWLNKDMCSWTMSDCIYAIIVMSILGTIIVLLVDMFDRIIRKRKK